MKTNYTTNRTPEAKEVITRIARYATRNMLRTTNKSDHYARIIDVCKKDINEYGLEQD